MKSSDHLSKIESSRNSSSSPDAPACKEQWQNSMLQDMPFFVYICSSFLITSLTTCIRVESYNKHLKVNDGPGALNSYIQISHARFVLKSKLMESSTNACSFFFLL